MNVNSILHGLSRRKQRHAVRGNRRDGPVVIRPRLESLEERVVPVVSGDFQYLLNAANQYTISANAMDMGNPIVPLYTDYQAGGTYTTIDSAVNVTLNGDDLNAGRGTSSFSAVFGTKGFFQFGTGAMVLNRPRDIPNFGMAREVRFLAESDQPSLPLQVNVFKVNGSGFQQIATNVFNLTTSWIDYPFPIPLLPPQDLHAVQFLAPNGGTVRLDEVRVDTDGFDPLRVVQSYTPLPVAAMPPPVQGTPQDRDLNVYPNHAFLYDNALEIIALTASGNAADLQTARDIAGGILATALADGSFYNVHNSGHVLLGDGKTPLMQLSPLRTLGDNSWFGLALLDLYQATGSSSYLTAARAISDWADKNIKDSGSSLQGYLGGYDDKGNPITSRATEFNVDFFQFNRRLSALLSALGDPSAQTYRNRAVFAANFVLNMFDKTGGKFWTGTLEGQGDAINTCSVPLDAQLWPLLTLGQWPEYANDSTVQGELASAVNWANNHLMVTDGAFTGLTFSSGSNSKVWFEGNAYAVLDDQLLADTARAQTELQLLDQARLHGPNADPAGVGQIAASSDGLHDPCFPMQFYDARLAVAPTAWTYLAAKGFNPFLFERGVQVLFAQGLDNQVYAQQLDAEGNPSRGYVLTQPGQVQSFTAAHEANGHAELFALGLDNQVYTQHFDANGNSTSGYALTTPGQVKSLTVGYDASNHPELFVIGLDSQVYLEHFDANGNSTSSYRLAAPGQVQTQAVGHDAANRPELFVLGLDGQVYALKLDANGNPSGGYFLTAVGRVQTVAVGQDASNHPELFVMGLDGQVYAQRFDANGSSTSGYTLTQAGRVQALAVGQDASNDPEVFVLGLDRQVYTQKFDASGKSTGSYKLTQPGGVKSLAVSRDASNHPELFVIGLDDQVYGQTFDAGGSSLTPYFLTQPGRVKAIGLSR